MPNYKITPALRAEIKLQIDVLCDRRIQTYNAGFPFDRIQLETMVNEPDTLKLMRTLDGLGVNQPKNPHIELMFDRSAWPGLQRSCTVIVQAPKPMLMSRCSATSPSGLKFTANTATTGMVLQHGMTPNDRAAIVAWLNAIVRERRIVVEVKDFTNQLLAYCDTSCDLLAAWPMFATLVTDSTWRQRMRRPPRTIGRYGSRALAFLNTSAFAAKRRSIVEAYLLAAQMLDRAVSDDTVTRAYLECWEH